MSRQLGKIRHPEVGLGLLPVVMAVLMATVISPAAHDIALVPLMSTGIVFGIALVLVFADRQVGKYLPRSLQL